jgi:polyhydroxybutyrate depolymerase
MASLARPLSLGSLVALTALTLVACTSDDGAGNPSGGGSGNGGGQGNAGSPAAGGSNAAGSNAAGSNAAGSSSSGSSMGGNGAGSGGAASAGGGAGGGGSGGTGGGAVTASPGCGMAAGQELGMWVEQPTLDVAGTNRQWWVWLPEGYDPSKAYPLIFNFHGCSNSNNIVPMQNVAGDQAVLVRGTGISDNVCWDASPTGDDLAFFDQMLADVVAKRCVDTSRVFATGYSSGSWLSNMLECERGDKLRAVGTVSGGTFGNKANCKGKFARIFIHDSNDLDNEIIDGNDDERDRLIEQNNCMAAAPVMEEPAPCARYQGCDAGYPVIWCETSGKGHDRQDSLAPGAFWKLFSSL